MNKNKHNPPQNIKHKPAFTIIEVVLVLAIAGLIFLMVFIALPALQRNQRDTQRRNDLSRMAAALQSYKANNRGSLPSSGPELRGNFRDNYLDGDSFRDPDGSQYYIANQSGASNRYRRFDLHDMKISNGDTYIYFISAARCGDGQIEDSGGSNNFVVFMMLEGGGSYCIDG